MVDYTVKNWQGQDAGQASLELKVASEDNASHLLHRAVVRQLANARQGTASSKTRAEVRGGGRKPWRQKGTGRARAGSIRSPLWRGGGVTFGPKPRDYSQKLNRKERRLALRTALISRSAQLITVENFAEQLAQPKTKELVEALTRWGVQPKQKVLLVLAEIPEAVYLSVRNIPYINLSRADSINVYDVLVADVIVATSEALATIQEIYHD
jgi:large subunit ribosomal protein L4